MTLDLVKDGSQGEIMNYKTFAIAAVTALTTFATSAQVATSDVVPVGGSFNSLSLGTIHLSTASNVMGALGSGVGTINFAAPGPVSLPFSLTLSPITFSSFSLTNILPNSTTLFANASLPSFSFSNLAAGTYQMAASGSVTGFGAAFAQYTVTAVPEPDTYAMLLAGLGLMGTIARRRKKPFLAG